MQELNLLGMKCPIPLMKTQAHCKMDHQKGYVFEVISDDPESKNDFTRYFEKNSIYMLLDTIKEDLGFRFRVKKVC